MHYTLRKVFEKRDTTSIENELERHLTEILDQDSYVEKIQLLKSVIDIAQPNDDYSIWLFKMVGKYLSEGKCDYPESEMDSKYNDILFYHCEILNKVASYYSDISNEESWKLAVKLYDTASKIAEIGLQHRKLVDNESIT